MFTAPASLFCVCKTTSKRAFTPGKKNSLHRTATIILACRHNTTQQLSIVHNFGMNVSSPLVKWPSKCVLPTGSTSEREETNLYLAATRGVFFYHIMFQVTKIMSFCSINVTTLLLLCCYNGTTTKTTWLKEHKCGSLLRVPLQAQRLSSEPLWAPASVQVAFRVAPTVGGLTPACCRAAAPLTAQSLESTRRFQADCEDDYWHSTYIFPPLPHTTAAFCNATAFWPTFL